MPEPLICKFKNGKDKAITAHIRIKYKENVFAQLLVQPLAKGKPEGRPLEIMLWKLADLYIDTGSSGAHHLCIVNNEIVNPESRILRIMIYKNQSDQPDPQATYALFAHLITLKDHPLK